MRILGVILSLLLVWTQGVLWFDEDAGLREVWQREARLEASLQRNAMKAARNAELAAEVQDLSDGRAAVEERARYELGMIGQDEIFIQINRPARQEPWRQGPNAPEKGRLAPTRTAGLN